ncbi:MAG TPA: type VI secretion system contractile sheath small subunit [Polyangiaceae bacterium]|nr:type VI secretion system contractile sheath small subunit [Polyangiaceae bacterium]
MSKPIQEDIFRSRLTITYRTNITGTPQEETLPYRLLVLGEFEGSHERDTKGVLAPLADRKIGSIRRSTSVKHHMRELQPTWAIPDGKLQGLRSYIPGQVTFQNVQCVVPRGEKSGRVQGEALFKSDPKDNGNLGVIEGKLTVSGKLDLDGNNGITGGNVYLRGVVSGKLSAGFSNGTVDIATGKIDETIAVEAVKALKLQERQSADVLSASRFDVTAGAKNALKVSAKRTVPFTSINCFSPDDVVLSVPELQRLRIIKGLVLELQGMLRNRVDLRDALKSMLPTSGTDKEKEAKLSRFKALRDWAKPALKFLQIEQTASAAATAASVAPGAAEALAAPADTKPEVKTDG